MTLEDGKSPRWREVCVLAPYGPKNDAILEDCTQQPLGLGMQTSSTSDEYVLMSLSPSSSTFQQCMTRRPTRRNASSNYFKHIKLAMPNVHCATTTKSPPSSWLSPNCLFISPHQVSLQEQWLWNLLHCLKDINDASGCDFFIIIYSMILWRSFLHGEYTVMFSPILLKLCEDKEFLS